MKSVTVSEHPLVLHRLAQLRDKATPPPLFRRLVHDITQILFVEASRDLRIAEVSVETPLTTCVGHRLSERVGLIPILRAGLGMADAILEMLPDAEVWHLGLYRDHTTHRPVTYYNKFDAASSKLDRCFVIDPMLATGGSAIEAINILKARRIHRVCYLGLIAAPEGVEALRAAHPDAAIHLGALDGRLDENKYIVPGLGDAGDRQFATFGE